MADSTPLTLRQFEYLLREPLDDPHEKLTQRCAKTLVEAIGPIAKWWLSPTALQAAVNWYQTHDPARAAYFDVQAPPPPPSDRGCCWIIFVRKELQEDSPWLRHTFLMPLRWVPDQPHDPKLPRALHDLADKVLNSLERWLGAQRSWGLQLWVDHEVRAARSREQRADVQPSLENIPCQPGSGWVPLASGLMLARHQLHPDPTVFATGEWYDESVREVEGAELKVDLAYESGAKKFWIPGGPALIEALSARSDGAVDVQPLQAKERDPVSALKAYRIALTVEPTAADPLEARQSYFRDLYGRRKSEFYARCLLDDVVKHCQRSLPDSLRPPQWRPTWLITVISHSPELALLACRVFQPRKLLALFTPQKNGAPGTFGDNADWVKDQRAAYWPDTETAGAEPVGCPEVVPKAISPLASPTEAIPSAVSEHTRGVPPEDVLINIGPGTVWLGVGLIVASREGNLLTNLQAETDVQNRPLPGTEIPQVWEMTKHRELVVIPGAEPSAD